MSTERWDYNGVQVSTHIGPVSAHQPDRHRVQITTPDDQIVLDMDEWRSLVQYVRLVGNAPREYLWLDREYDRGVVRDGIMVCVDLGRKIGD